MSKEHHIETIKPQCEETATTRNCWVGDHEGKDFQKPPSIVLPSDQTLSPPTVTAAPVRQPMVNDGQNYVIPYYFRGPINGWCPGKGIAVPGSTAGQIWQSNHMPCFDHEPSRLEVIQTMKQVGCGGGPCGHNMTQQEMLEHKTDILGKTALVVGAVGIGYFIGALILFLVVLSIATAVVRVFARASAEVRREVWTDGQYHASHHTPLTPIFRTILVLVAVIGLFWYLGLRI